MTPDQSPASVGKDQAQKKLGRRVRFVASLDRSDLGGNKHERAC